MPNNVAVKENNSGARSSSTNKSVNAKGMKNVSSTNLKRLAHPFICRLKDTAAFTVNSPLALIGAGFASLWMGLFTLFRPTPVLLYSLACRTKESLAVEKTVIIVLLFSWQGTIIFVLLFLGFLLSLSRHIKKRWVLMLHPWGLLLLYFDAAVWICVTLSLQLETGLADEPVWLNDQVHYPIVYFIYIYIESVCFGLMHYTYATYFITAELTVIERSSRNLGRIGMAFKRGTVQLLDFSCSVSELKC